MIYQSKIMQSLYDELNAAEFETILDAGRLVGLAAKMRSFNYEALKLAREGETIEIFIFDQLIVHKKHVLIKVQNGTQTPTD